MRKISKIKIMPVLVAMFLCVMMSFFITIVQAQAADIVAPETGFNQLTWYKFDDETNLGKDSLGNYDLIAKNVAIDPVVGGIALKDNGLLYAPAIGDVAEDNTYTDFSDLIKGSFSVSMRAYLRSNNGGANTLFTTGAYGSHFGFDWAYGGLALRPAPGDTGFDGEDQIFNDTFAWYRMNYTYDDNTKTVKLTVTKEGDSAYIRTFTNVLDNPITFGGQNMFSFTIGAQSHLGEWVDSHVSADLNDGTTIYPNISDFRIYTGVIDDAEIANIAKYDAGNLEQEGYNALAWYKFDDETNLGKDSLGNHDLIAKNVAIDPVVGGIALKDNGLLYAPAIGDVAEDNTYTDFSDLIEGSFSISMRAYLRSNNGGGNTLFTTGAYGSHLAFDWGYGGLAFRPAPGDTGLGGEDQMFNDTFAWYRINYTYDDNTRTVTIIVTKEGDSAYIRKYTNVLDNHITFGGHNLYGFTIGAQSHLGAWDDSHASAELNDGTKIHPNISDFRIYTGVIDDAEIANIAKYDADNLAAVEIKKYDSNPIASYTFEEANNLGMDEMGNFDLIIKNPSDASQVDGALVLKNNNILYAHNIGNNHDISDILTAFTFTIDVKTAVVGNEEVDILSTSRYADGLRITLCGADVRLYHGTSSPIVANSVFSGTAEWYRIIVTGNTETNTIVLYVNKIGDTEVTQKGVVNNDKVVIGTDLCFTLGGWSKFGSEDWAYSNPTIDNVKIYDYMFSAHQANEYLTSSEVKTTTPTVVSVIQPQSKITIDKNLTEVDILSLELPQTTKVSNLEGNQVDAKIVWTRVEKNEFNAVIHGFIMGPGINNFDNHKVELVLEYVVDESEKVDIKPIVWYEFNDPSNIGKDSMGNFDLLLGGNQQVLHNAKEGYVSFNRDNASYLYAPAVLGQKDWAELISGGYTVSITFKSDNTITAADQYMIANSAYGEGFMIVGAYNSHDIVYSSGGYSEHHITYNTGSFKDKVVTLTLTADPKTNTIALYIDGQLFEKRVVDSFNSFAPEGNLYTFALGAQCTVSGRDGAQFFSGDIYDVKVYDFALSSRNVFDMYSNMDSEKPFESVVNYRTVKEVNVDLTDVDTVISSINTLDDIFAGLPSIVSVKMDNDECIDCEVYWLGRQGSQVVGYVKCADIANIDGIKAIVDLSFAIDMDVKDHAVLENVTVDGTPYIDGTTYPVGQDAVVSFNAVADNHYVISSVALNGNKLLPDENGLYTATINDYSVITVFVVAKEYTITYVLNNGEENSTSVYTYGEAKELDDWYTKEGYVFEGWYLNADFTGEKVTSIDTTNPKDITLYAKWSKIGDTGSDDPTVNPNPQPGIKGCGGSVVASLFAMVALCGAVVIFKKREE